jgi:hypothetical protein
MQEKLEKIPGEVYIRISNERYPIIISIFIMQRHSGVFPRGI